MPPRLRLVPRDRGPARRHPPLLPHRAADRPLAGPRPRLAARPRGRARRRVLRRRRRAGRRSSPTTCARCHSSQPGPYDNVDFRATDPADPTLRLDWLGNDEVAARVGDRHLSRPRRCTPTTCRAGSGREYASLDRAEPPGRPAAPGGDEGRRAAATTATSRCSRPGRMRPSCTTTPSARRSAASPSAAALDFYSSPYVDAAGKPLADPPACLPFDPSVEGRYALYKASMQELLNPDQRDPEDVRARQRHRHRHRARSVEILGHDLGLSLTIPAGLPGGRRQLAALQGPDPGPGPRRPRPGQVRGEVRDAPHRRAAAGAARRALGDPRRAARDGVDHRDRAGARATRRRWSAGCRT